MYEFFYNYVVAVDLCVVAIHGLAAGWDKTDPKVSKNLREIADKLAEDGKRSRAEMMTNTEKITRHYGLNENKEGLHVAR